ncbi:hypothetical protein AB3S75_000706 [Citrus x aurantiifolia]
MLCKIINSQAPVSTRVSSPPPESSQKRPHEAAVSSAKRDHDRKDPPDFRPPPPEFNSSQQHLQNPIPTTAQKSLELPRPANKFARGVDLDYCSFFFQCYNVSHTKQKKSQIQIMCL